jgi:hypothetical protein
MLENYLIARLTERKNMEYGKLGVGNNLKKKLLP